MDVVLAYRNRMKNYTPIPPRVVKTGPVLENIDRDGDVNVLKFPVPLLHERDSGRYPGTHDLVITRDPDGGWVNCGTYRVMVHNEKRLGVRMSPGKQGRQRTSNSSARPGADRSIRASRAAPPPTRAR